MPTALDGNAELWRRLLERLRERFINAGDDYERRHDEPLGLFMVQDDGSDLAAGTRQLVLKHYAMQDTQRHSLGMDKLNRITTRNTGSRYGEWLDGKPPSVWREVYLSAAVLDDQPAESTFRRLTKDASTHFGGVPWPIVNLFPADSWADSHYRWLWCMFDAAWPNAVDNPLNAGRWYLKSASPPWQDYLYLDWKAEQVLPGCFLSQFDDYYNASVAFIDWLLCVDESKLSLPTAGGERGEADGKQAKRKPGRPKGSLTTDPKADEMIANEWAGGHRKFATHEELAIALQKPVDEVSAALKRHQGRQKHGK